MKLPEDLNYDAGGDYIYIAFRRKANANDNLLTGLRVELVNHRNEYSSNTNASNIWYGVSQGYYGTTMQDLNEEAGGYTVYLYYTYDQLNVK